MAEVADWETECDCCGQVPTIRDVGMCAACTFGEADAQQELINGEMKDFNNGYQTNYHTRTSKNKRR